MIVDASALLAILLGEPEAAEFARLLSGSSTARISVVNYLEAAVRIDREGIVSSSQAFDGFLDESGLTLAPVTETQARIARLAYLRFGKGRHPAGLNLGDVFAYALSKETGEPLLFKGDDFSRTDVEPAWTGPSRQS